MNPYEIPLNRNITLRCLLQASLRFASYKLCLIGAQRPDCQIYEIFMVGAEAKLSFTTCTCRPFYVDHVPIGKSHADDLYNNGKLLNDYAKSGRFRIEDAGESCALSITNVKTLDAGKYICREQSGLGGMHDKDIIVRGTLIWKLWYF